MCSVCVEGVKRWESWLWGKKGSLIRMRDAVSSLSLRANQTANLGIVSAVISLLQCNAVDVQCVL